MRRRRFSREFKVEGVKLVRERGVSVAQAARDLDVHENVLRKWVKEFGADPAQAFPGHRSSAARVSEVTYFVALPFVATDDGVAAGEPMECFNPVAVVMRSEALSRKEGHVGAVAFSRTGDPATGDFSDAKVIRRFGEVPDDLSTL